MRLGRATCLVMILAVFSAFSARAAVPPTVVATIAQIGQPLGVIAGDCARVESLLGEGVDPHLYQPTRADMKRLLAADLVLANGHNLEAGLHRALAALADRGKVLYIAETIDRARLLPWSDHHSDPHVWMDPNLWRDALTVGVARVAALVPPCAAAMTARAMAFFAEVDGLNAYAKAAIASIPAETRMLVTAHDAFAYFGRRYGIELQGVQGISTESEAGLARIEQMVRLLVDRKVPAVFVETSVSDRLVRALIEGAAAAGHTVRIGGTLYSDAMGAPGSYRGTYIGMLDHNSTTIARALGGQAAGFSPQLAKD
jgi:manganese/zinc/iron transport system substrate-binding protein